MVERHYYFHGVKQQLARVMTGAFKRTARRYKKAGLNESGAILAILMIIIGIISITSMATLGTLRREVKKVNKDYFDLVALFAAESGIELAKRDMFAGRKVAYSQGLSPRKLEFEYGNEHFPENAGRIINCRVIAYVHPDRVYIESNAEVLNKPVARSHSSIVAKRTSKKLIIITGSPPKLSTVWKVYN